MQTVLHITASGTPDSSVSAAATRKIIAGLGPAKVITRDLAATPLPQVDAAWINARLVPTDAQTEADRETLALSDALISELKSADIVVVAMPIYNFGMPAALKAWVDLIARPKITFAYTENGPVGLLDGKSAIVAVASGGVPVDSPADFATPHLRQVLRFIGIENVTVNTAKDILAENAA